MSCVPQPHIPRPMCHNLSVSILHLAFLILAQGVGDGLIGMFGAIDNEKLLESHSALTITQTAQWGPSASRVCLFLYQVV